MSHAQFTRRGMMVAAVAGTSALSALPASATGTTTSTGDADGFTNPVVAANHPDPAVLRAGDCYYLYSTAGTHGHMPCLVSSDLVSWDLVGNAMPEIASWSTSGRHWAPEVIEIDGAYHAYYTARETATDRQAIGVAVAEHPAGPFVDSQEAPLLSTPQEGGCIDASPFRDEDGTLWLLWKNDGNAADQDSFIYAQPLTADGLSLSGERTRILERDQDWEIYTIEGSTIIDHDGRYYLFYSAGEYWNESYGVGCAVAEAVEGPWTKLADTPILAANDVAAGPGHGVPIRTDSGLWYVYHAWHPDHIGEDPGRQVWLSPITIDGNDVDIDGPRLENPTRP